MLFSNLKYFKTNFETNPVQSCCVMINYQKKIINKIEIKKANQPEKLGQPKKVNPSLEASHKNGCNGQQ